MTVEQFIDWNPATKTRGYLDQIIVVIDELRSQGYTLTLRQLHYQLVSRDIYANTQRNYARLSSWMTNARMAGLVSFSSLEDRNRNISEIATWNKPSEILSSAAIQYREDLWKTQPIRPIVLCEKDALTGVIYPICRRQRVAYLACRGYLSTSTMYELFTRFSKFQTKDSEHRQNSVVLYLGDHDPSGLQMVEDIQGRLETMFSQYEMMSTPEVIPIALTMEQIIQFNPPPNPAKQTDSRAKSYIEKFGSQSWELDALPPSVLDNLITTNIQQYRDEELWTEAQDAERNNRNEMLDMISKLS